MGLWDDDFYSTKPTRSWLRGGRASGGYPANNTALLFLLIAAAFALAAVLLFLLARIAFDNSVADSPEDRLVKAVQSVDSAVVGVVLSQTEGKGALPPESSIGSGVIFEKAGAYAYVVTNEHVVNHPGDIAVIMMNGDRKQAEIVGKDRITDLAVLRIDAAGVKKIAGFGDSADLKAGQTAIAIGNPLGLAFSQTITVGVISSPIRAIPVSLNNDNTPDWELEVIQTDAAINFGNSGGALVNLDGRVIGINSRKIADPGVEGMGFAIPSNRVKPIVQSLIKYGSARRPYLGVYPQDLQSFQAGTEVLQLPDKVKTGVVVVEATGPAKLAGMTTNDVIVAFDETPIHSSLELRKYLYEKKSIGDKIDVSLYRSGKLRKVTVTLGQLQEE